ncbi:ArnT family glycosyltransferase [Capsulimonas corticalis]|nr:glycosyltransferase family 39 protein [Capsulimonas corticalis]
MNSLQGKLLPHFYNYGSLQIYLVNFADTFGYLFGAAPTLTPDPAAHPNQFARLYLIGRLLSALMGVGTVAALYAAGKSLWGRRAGLAAAALLAIAPLHAQHSHWLTVDVPGAFWATLSLLFAAKVLKDERFSWRGVLASAIFAGLAAATKYNLALSLLPLLAALWLRGSSERRQAVAGALGAIGAFAAAFVAACPGSVLESAKFIADIQYEALHVSQQPGDTFSNTGSGFVYHIVTNLSAGLGWPLLLAALASIVWAAKRRSQGDGLLAAFALPYYLLIGLAAVRYARYALPLIPILCLWAGRAIADISLAKTANTQRLGLACALTISALTFGWTIILIAPMSQADPRDLALAWIQSRTNLGIQTAFPTMPWFQTAPLSPYFCAPRPGTWKQIQIATDDERILYRNKDWDSATAQQQHPTFVVLSQYDTRDALRLGNKDAEQYMAMLSSDYRLGAQFGGYRLFGGPVLTLPHDMLYANPNISLYVKR